MNKLIKKIHNNKWEDIEIIDTPETEYIEENIFVDEILIKNKELIRVDMNIVQFPIFSKNTRKKINQIIKYYFNKNRDTYITVTPQAGDYIPGEMEEKIFIALMQLMKEKNMPKKFIISSIELKNKIKMSTAGYNEIIGKSLTRLASTNYTFKNTLYSNESGGILEEKIETSIFNIRTISLSKKENEKYRKLFSDKRTKTIYEIEFSEHFYKNIIQKGYMVYNGDTLLEIENSTARTIYMLIEKLRFDNLYLKIDTLFLIKRIPLKYEKKNLTQTIKTLNKAFEELVERNLIISFNFIKESTWEKSEIEINFNENANVDKQGRFYKDRNDFRKMLSDLTISNTEHNLVEDIEIIEQTKDIKITKDVIDKIINLMPKKAKELKTMPKTIKEAIETYGYDKVEKTAIYMKKNKVEKVRSYFLKALENNWGEDEKISVIEPVKSPEKTFEEEIGINIPQYNESLYIEFEKLEKEVQNGIEVYAYRDYIKICGMETKIQQLAFMGSRKKYICEYLEKYPEILGRSIVKKEETKKTGTILTDIKEVRAMIENAVELADMLHKYSEKDRDLILSKIIREVIQVFNRKELTDDKLNEIIDEYIKIQEAL